MRNTIQPAPALVVIPHNVPRSLLGISRFEHLIARSRVVIPAIVRFNIHWAQFPLPERVVDTGLESPVLLFLADFEPDFDQSNAGVDNVLFDLGAELQKPLVLRFVDKTHYMFDADAVVVTAVENDDFTGSRKMRDVTLNIHLALLALGRRRQGDNPKNARADPLGDGLDRAAFARRVTALEDNDDPRPFGLDPILQPAELDLQLVQLFLIGFTLEFLCAFVVGGHGQPLSICGISTI